MKSSRPYAQGARAASAEATRQRILHVTADLMKSRFRVEIRLEDVAREAKVTVQTVLNIFDNRAAVLDAAWAEMLRNLRAQRLSAEPGNIVDGIMALMDHYEQFGDLVVRNLVEQADPEFIAIGRAGHRQWVRRQFSLQIAQITPPRRTLIDELVCACDVYTWKLLRRDLGRSRAQTEATILAMVTALLAA